MPVSESNPPRSEDTGKPSSCWKFLRYFIHEVRTPLNAVHGFTELLKDETDPQELDLGIERIKRNAYALEELIGQAAEMVYLEDGVYQFSFRRFNPADILRQVESKALESAGKKGIRFHLTLPPDSPALFTDEHRLRQVLDQLVGNAIRWTESGVVSLELKSSQDGGARFILNDTGHGISEDDLQRLKTTSNEAGDDPFPRISGGLALIVARRMLELMDLTFMIDSQLGSGTRIWFDVPPRDDFTS